MNFAWLRCFGLHRDSKRWRQVLEFESLEPRMLLSGSADDLLVAYNNTIGEYSTSGAVVNAQFIPSVNNPQGIAVTQGNIYAALSGDGDIAQYNSAGLLVNSALIDNLAGPYGIVASGADLFVISYNVGVIGEYTTAGNAVNDGLVTVTQSQAPLAPIWLAVSGSDLFVAEANYNNAGETDSRISEYSSVTGAVINENLITDVTYPRGVAVAGSDLFVASNSGIGEYTLDGTPVNTSLITATTGNLAVDGSDLFVFAQDGTISEYTTSGALVNADLVTGLTTPGQTTPAAIAVLLPAPLVTTNPVSQTVLPGSTVTLTAATNDPTDTVQWQISPVGGPGFYNIPGATSPTYQFTAEPEDNGALYQAVFTNSQSYAVATTSAALTVATTPTAPTGLAASNGNSPLQVALQWNPVAGAASYQIFRGTTPYNETKIAANVASTAYGDGTATPGVQYFYSVRAVNIAGLGPNAGPVSGFAPLPAPANVAATQGTLPRHVSITWNAVPGATSYQVFRGTSPSNQTKIAAGVTIDGYNDLSAANNTEYYYSVRAMNALGLGLGSVSMLGFKEPTDSPGLAALQTPHGASDDADPPSIPTSDLLTGGADNVNGAAGLLEM